MAAVSGDGVSAACLWVREHLAPYVLRQLPAEDSVLVAGHLRGCAACGALAEELRLPARALALADPRHLGDAPVWPRHRQDATLAAVLRRAERERPGSGTSRQRLVVLAAAAAVLLAVALGVRVLGPGRAGPEQVALSGASGVVATVTLSGRDAVTGVDLSAHGLVAGVRYGLWLQRRDGTRRGSPFTAGTDGSARVTVVVDVGRDEAVAVGVTRLPAQDVATARLPG